MIDQTIQVVINAPHQDVYNYISDLRNDREWRTEVISTSSQADLEIGNIAIESSFLSRKIPQYIRRLECIAFQQNDMILYQTLDGAPHYLKSTRSVRICEGGSTRFIYRLEFDQSIVKHALGFSLPKLIIDVVTRRSMRNYMNNLKIILETNV
jgi:hypothetical protein